MRGARGQNVSWVDGSLAGAESKLRPFEILASYDEIVWVSWMKLFKTAISTL